MKARTLAQLVIALVLLGALAWFNQQKSLKAAASTAGQKALPAFDANAVEQLKVISGTQTVELARVESGWVVTSLWNAPANFDQLSELLRKLEDMKIGDIVADGADTLEEFGLASSNNVPAIPAELRLSKADGTELGKITLGQPLMPSSSEGFAMPDSQYARVGNGPILLVAPYIPYVPRRAEDWMNRSICEVQANKITAIRARSADGTEYGVTRTNDTFSGSGTLAEKAIGKTEAERWTHALQRFNAAGIYDPASDRGELGLDHADTLDYETRDGMTIKIQLGKADEEGNRPSLVSVNWQAPALPEGLDEAGRSAAEKEQQAISESVVAMQKRVTPWIFKIPAGTASQLVLASQQLIEGATPSQPQEPMESR